MACISGRKGRWGTPFSRSSLRIRDWNSSSKRGGVQAAGMKRASSCGDIFACTKPAGKTEPITASTRAASRTEVCTCSFISVWILVLQQGSGSASNEFETIFVIYL